MSENGYSANLGLWPTTGMISTKLMILTILTILMILTILTIIDRTDNTKVPKTLFRSICSFVERNQSNVERCRVAKMHKLRHFKFFLHLQKMGALNPLTLQTNFNLKWSKALLSVRK